MPGRDVAFGLGAGLGVLVGAGMFSESNPVTIAIAITTNTNTSPRGVGFMLVFTCGIGGCVLWSGSFALMA